MCSAAFWERVGRVKACSAALLGKAWAVEQGEKLEGKAEAATA